MGWMRSSLQLAAIGGLWEEAGAHAYASAQQNLCLSKRLGKDMSNSLVGTLKCWRVGIVSGAACSSYSPGSISSDGYYQSQPVG